MRLSGKLAVYGFCLIIVGACFSAEGNAQKYKTDWLSARWTPCEGVGIHGSARYYYEATQTANADGTLTISTVAVYGSSASFSPDDTRLTASLEFTGPDMQTQTINLERPSVASLEPEPGPTETRRIYLPSGQKITIAPGGTIKVTVAASKQNCSINNSSKTIDPFSPPH